MKRVALLTVCTIMALLAIDAQTFAPKKKLPHKFEIKVTGVNNTNRDGTTRIRCDVLGYPHTSQRIDKVLLKHKGKTNEAIDIDGVDFNRYFQWEDDGVITMEIDFPRQKFLEPSDSLIFQTLNGPIGTTLGKIKSYR